jgi:hypothetical protein
LSKDFVGCFGDLFRGLELYKIRLRGHLSKSPRPALFSGYLRLKGRGRLLGQGASRETRLTSPYVGYALLVAAFVVFLLDGNVAPAIALLAIGVVFVVAGGRRTAGKMDAK